MSSLLAIPALVFMLSVTTALGQNGAAPSNQARDPKPSDCLSEEKGIRPPKTPGNAAWKYFEVWDSLSSTERAELAQIAYARVIQDQPPKLEPAKRQLLLTHQPYIEGLMQAAAMDECDWGVQHQYGADFRLPHLGLLRTSYRSLHMDLDRCIEDGSAIDAAARLAAIARLSNQTRGDETWISALVGGAISYAAVERTRELIKTGPITPASAKIILAAFRSIQQDDLFGWKSATSYEVWEYTQWPRQVCKGDHAGAMYCDRTGYAVWNHPYPPDIFLLGLTEQQLNAHLDALDRYLKIIVPLWGRPENDLRLRELEVEAREGQFGLLGALHAEMFEQMRRGMARDQRRIQAAIHDLEVYVRTAEKQRQ